MSPAPRGNDYAVGNDGGAPEGNTNALKHGVYADPAHLLDTLDGSALAWVERQYQGYLSLAPFDESDPRAERLKMVVVLMWQEWTARAETMREGMTVEVPTGETGPDGKPLHKRRAHPLLAEASRLNRDIRAQMKSLGLDTSGNSDKARERTHVEIVVPPRE